MSQAKKTIAIPATTRPQNLLVIFARRIAGGNQHSLHLEGWRGVLRLPGRCVDPAQIRWAADSWADMQAQYWAGEKEAKMRRS